MRASDEDVITIHPDRRAQIRDNRKHLRLPYQLTLAPFFLWGYYLARPVPEPRILAAFAAFHLFLYPGVTAFNSHYDRDSGPVGGLEQPPAVHPTLLPVSLALQGVGGLLAATVGPQFLGVYGLYLLLGILYSHPAIRCKGRPVAGTLVVILGQGGLGSLAGWSAASPQVAAGFSGGGGLALAAAVFTALGLFPLTQVFQIQEDRRRGDRTLCVALGCRGALRLSQGALALAGAAAIAVAVIRGTAGDAALLGGGYLALGSAVKRLAAACERDPANGLFHRVTTILYASAAAFTLFIGMRVPQWRPNSPVDVVTSADRQPPAPNKGGVRPLRGASSPR